MATAHRTKDIAAWGTRLEGSQTKKEARSTAQQEARAKSFNSMTRAEKDTILLLAAQMLGIIED